MTTEPEAPPDKAAKARAKYPCQARLGCRLVGARVWDGAAYADYDKAWGCGLRDERALARGLGAFFRGAGAHRARRALLAEFRGRLADLLAWFERHEGLVFISSSLLFVYDGARPPRAVLKMIDFAHVRHDGARDAGYVVGLRRVISLFDALLDEVDDGDDAARGR